MKHILILQRNNELEAWGSLTALCRAHGLPYHSLKAKGFPIEELKHIIHKVPYNTKTIV